MASIMTAVHPVPYANGASDPAPQGGNSSGQPSTISANDFLTLLVTEMKNQDPTAQTDPNEYINQLVQVNSLEQLIQINQELSTAVGSSKPTGHAIPGSPAHFAASSAPASATATHPAADSRSAASPSEVRGVPAASGNLSVPAAKPAAHRIATALSGRK
jgi:flagellar basal-body rod modification protein FlgD